MKKIHTTKLLICFIAALVAMNAGQLVYAQAGNITVNGTVVSADNGEALPSVNILIQGTSTGTTTDLDGNYTITAPSDGILVYSYVGYVTLEESINNRSEINVSLVTQDFIGDDLVVVGYGAVQRRDMTGSVSSISAQDIQEVPVINVQEALQGRAAGVMVMSSGNRPGDSPTIRVRGRRSLTATNDPLYVVDGIPYDGDINHINTRDIESIEVLKDASATAIYGSRGANGVILVTTARGGDYSTRVSYSGSSGMSQAIGTIQMMNAEQFAQMKREANRTAGLWNGPEDDADIFTAFELQALADGYSANFQDLVLETGHQQNHQLSIQGGDSRTRFNLSGNYFNEEGITGNQDFTRYSFRINLDHDVSDRFRVGTSSMMTNQNRNFGSNPYGSSMAVNPMSVPYDDDGNIVLRPGADPLVLSPLVNLIPGAFENQRSSMRLFSNMFAELDIMDNLNYRINFGPSLESRRDGLYQSSLGGERTDRARKQHNTELIYTAENILTYENTFSDVHRLNIMGLQSIQSSTKDSTLLESRVLPYESQRYHNIGTGEDVNSYGSGYEEWGMMSFAGRVNYSFMDRYLFTVTGRWDGSSRLAEGNKWGFFPSAAFVWRMVDEPFMSDQALFSDLRLRASYGVTGNTGIRPYQTRGGLGRTGYSFNDQPAFGFRPVAIANPELKWETSAQVNFGLDFGFLDDRITGSIEVYETNTTDLILQRQLPITSGFNNVLENIGETRNRGFEFTINSRNIVTNNFSWTTNLNLFANNEEIVDLYGTGEDEIGSGWFIGEPITAWYDYEKIGIWQLSEADQAAAMGFQPGEIKIMDQNGDGIINQDDRIILGSDIPTLNGGLHNRFTYRRFDLSVFMFGSFGHTIYNNFRVGHMTLQGRYNNLDIDYWTPDNPTNEAPRADGTREFPQYRTSMAYQAGDFLKIRNIQFGYDLPTTLLDKLGIRSMNVYANVDNPIMFHTLQERNLDPETDNGVVNNQTPSRRMFTVGMNINFN